MNPVPIRTVLLSTIFFLAACGGGDGPVDPGPQTGTVAGRVALADGTGVQNAAVALSGHGTQTTGATGAFTFSSVPAGTYTLSVTAPSGFEIQGSSSQSVTVAASQTQTVNFTMRRPSGGGAAATEVRLNAVTFNPSAVTIQRGGIVRWINVSGVHNITPNNPNQPGAWQAVDISGSQTFEHTFATAGTFAYSCTLHSGMNGTVVVQ